MERVGILIVDNDEASQTALRHMLDSEGWRLRVVPAAQQALAELASGNWNLVIANVALTGLDGPVFSTLRELALAPTGEAARGRLRVLFAVPEAMGEVAQSLLESQRLPYIFKPFHLHDFLEKISDLLLEVRAIPAPIRRVRGESRSQERRLGQGGFGAPERRETSMFSGRSDYFMTEEEIAEFEKQEATSRRRPKKS